MTRPRSWRCEPRARRWNGHEVDPTELDLIVYSGSMHKDFYVWSAANRIQYLLGATNAWAFELAALCTTNVVALKVTRDLMRSDPRLRTVLICGGHRTADLINYRDQSIRFLFNLSDGGSAMVLRRGHGSHTILDASFITDGSLSEDVTIPAGGTRLPTSQETLSQGRAHVPRLRSCPLESRPRWRLGKQFCARGD